MFESGCGGPISIRLTPGAHPDSSREDIQFAPLLSPPGPPPPYLGHECPTRGLPSVALLPRLLVQSLHVPVPEAPPLPVVPPPGPALDSEDEPDPAALLVMADVELHLDRGQAGLPRGVQARFTGLSGSITIVSFRSSRGRMPLASSVNALK